MTAYAPGIRRTRAPHPLLRIAVLVGLLILGPRSAAAETWTWVGGGGDMNWNNAGNWRDTSLATGVPAAGDSVEIPSGEGTVLLNTAVDLGQFNCDSTLQIEPSGELVLGDGSISSIATLSFTGSNARIAIGSGGLLSVDALVAGTSSGKTIDGPGIFQINTSASIERISFGPGLQLRNFGVMTFKGPGGSLYNATTFPESGTFSNFGTVRIGYNGNHEWNPAPGLVFHHYGLLQTSTWRAWLNGVNSWDFIAHEGSVIDIEEAGHNQDMAIDPGSAGTAEFHGTINLLDSSTTLYTLNATFDSTAVVTGGTGTILQLGGNNVIKVADPDAIGVEEFSVGGGTTRVERDLNVQDLPTSISATLEITSGTTVTVNGYFGRGSRLVGPGTLHLKGSTTTDAFNCSDGVNVINDGTWLHYYRNSLSRDIIMQYTGGLYSTLVNNGQLELRGRGMETSAGGASFTNNGTLYVNRPGTNTNISNFDVANPGSIILKGDASGAYLNITGTFLSATTTAPKALFEGTYDIEGVLNLPVSDLQVSNADVTLRKTGSWAGVARISGLGTSSLHVSGATAAYRVVEGATASIPGALELTDGEIQIDAGSSVSTSGAYTQHSGDFHLDGGSFTSASAAQLLGGVFRGHGSMMGSVDNVGATISPEKILPSSPLSITGDFSQGVGGTTLLVAGGDASDYGWGQLTIGGGATLGGTIQLASSTWSPSAGDAFQPVTYGSYVGVFGTEVLPTIPESVGADWITETLPTYWEARVAGVYTAISLDPSASQVHWLDPTTPLEKSAGFGPLTPLTSAPTDARLGSSLTGQKIHALLDPGPGPTYARIDASTGAVEWEVFIPQHVSSLAVGAGASGRSVVKSRGLESILPTSDPEATGSVLRPEIIAAVRPFGSPGHDTIGQLDGYLGLVGNQRTVAFGPGSAGIPSLDLLAFSPENVLYGLDASLLELWRIDLGDASADLVGVLDPALTALDGMSFLGSSLWVSRSSTGELFELDPADGSLLTTSPLSTTGLAGLTRRDCVGDWSGVLEARDKPADAGGVILLDWSGYTLSSPATDVSFHIYRDTDPCVLGLDRDSADFVAEILDGGSHSLEDSTSSDFTRYFYRLEVYGIPEGETHSILLDLHYSRGGASRPNAVISEFAPGSGGGKRIGEQVEIQNLSPDPLDLTGFRLSNGVDSEALTGIIPGDGFLVVVVSTLVLDPLGGTLTLLPPDGSDLVIDTVSWGTEGGAPAVPTGFTIQRVDGTDAEDPDYDSWEAGTESYGATNQVPPPALGSSLVFNEVYHSGGVGTDYIEIVNPLGSSVVMDSLAISDGAGFLDYIIGVTELSPGGLHVLDANSPAPFTRDLTATTLYLYQITSSGQLQRIDQLGWGTMAGDLVPPDPTAPNDALVRTPDGVAAYLGDQGANWYECGGDTYLFYGPQSPGLPNLAAGQVALSVDPSGSGDHTSIGAALTAAGPGTRILIEPGVYPESLTLVSGVDLTGMTATGEEVLITGDGLGPAVVGVGLDQSTSLSNLVVSSAAGGMALTDCSILVSNVSFVDNRSAGDGAAVLIDGGTPKFTSCLFDGNETTADGGAVQVLAGTPEFRYCLFVLNKAQNGAAIHQAGGSTVLENSVLDRNDATGGVLHAAGGEIHSEHSIVSSSLSGAALRAVSGANEFSCGLIFDEAEATPLEESGVVRSSVLDADPMFCQPGFLNYTYSEASPLVAHGVACGETIGIAGPPCAMTVTSAPGIPVVANRLLRPAPNPFNPTTMLSFELSRPGRVDLEIYDVRGRLVDRPVHGQFHAAGSFQIPWRGRDARGQGIASGVYFVVLRVDGARAGESMRVVLLK